MKSEVKWVCSVFLKMTMPKKKLNKMHEINMNQL